MGPDSRPRPYLFPALEWRRYLRKQRRLADTKIITLFCRNSVVSELSLRSRLLSPSVSVSLVIFLFQFSGHSIIYILSYLLFIFSILSFFPSKFNFFFHKQNYLASFGFQFWPSPPLPNSPAPEAPRHRFVFPSCIFLVYTFVFAFW